MSRSIILYLILFLSAVSCNIAKTDSDSGFASLLSDVESDPRLYLEKHGESGPFDLSAAGEAEKFLLRSLSRNYIDRECFPSRDSMQTAIETFGNGKHTKALLEGMYLMSALHEHKGETDRAVFVLHRIADMSEDTGDKEMLYCASSRIAHIHNNVSGMVLYRKYSDRAKTVLEVIDIRSASVRTRTEMLENLIMASEPEPVRNMVEFLDNGNIGQENPFFPKYRRLKGKYLLYYLRDSVNAEKELCTALEHETSRAGRFNCHYLLMDLYYREGNAVRMAEARDSAEAYIGKGAVSGSVIPFYLDCINYSGKLGLEDDSKSYRQDFVAKYIGMLENSSSHSVNDYSYYYEMLKEKDMHSAEVIRYLAATVFLLFVSLVLTVIYFRSRKRSMSRLIEFQKKISELENLKESLRAKNAESGEMVKSYIKRDIEVAKNLARTEYASAEKGEWMFNELFRTSALKDNELALRQWEKFYRQIDICYDGFHTKLLQRYPSLSERDVQLCCMLLVGMKTEEIAGIWNKSNFTVRKYRSDLRKTLHTGDGADIAEFLVKELLNTENVSL